MGETVEEDEEEDCLAEELWEEDARAEAVNEAGEEEAVEEDEEKPVLSRDVWPTRFQEAFSVISLKHSSKSPSISIWKLPDEQRP